MSSPPTSTPKQGFLRRLFGKAAGALAAINPFSASSPAENTSDRVVLTEQEAYHVLGFSFSSTKKWLILTSVFIVQISMNFNAAIYGNAGAGMAEEFRIP